MMNVLLNILRFLLFVIMICVVGMSYWTYTQLQFLHELQIKESDPPVVEFMPAPDTPPCITDMECQEWEESQIRRYGERDGSRAPFPDDMLECEAGDHSCID